MDQRQSVSVSRVVSCTELIPGIFDLRLETGIARHAMPGQFVGVYPKDETKLLPRPVSVCDTEGDILRLVFRVSGAGTAQFSLLRPGEQMRLIGPLGNGYPLERMGGKDVLLIGGGIGIPPLLFLAKALSGGFEGTGRDELCSRRASSVTAALGYREPILFLDRDFASYAKLLLACDVPCGLGIQGTALDAVLLAGAHADVICACGPKPMLKEVKIFADETETWLSLEERMACGVGACLACVTATTETDSHSNVKNARVCTEGPVFAASRVVL